MVVIASCIFTGVLSIEKATVGNCVAVRYIEPCLKLYSYCAEGLDCVQPKVCWYRKSYLTIYYLSEKNRTTRQAIIVASIHCHCDFL